ncbi:MAG: acyltransferase domain-containing protein, partial [Pseudomonadota bacterium]
MKRLADALKDGDPIRAVIRGSAINQDGRSNVLTAPNGAAQRDVIQSALDQAGINGAAVSYIETHGTGTKVGDPIEVEALVDTVGHSAADETCFLGAVKANLGHLEGAAGVAALIKVVLCLEHQAIPKQVHFKTLNPLVSLEGSRLQVPTELTPWPSGESGRIAGISSFGFSGTNVHIVVEQAPALPRPAAAQTGRPYILPISAGHDAGVIELRDHYLDLLAQSPGDEDLTDLCYTAARKRIHHASRLGVSGENAAQLHEDLKQAVAVSQAHNAPKLGFVFAGQGSEWLGMGRSLLAVNSIFRESIRSTDKLLSGLSDWSIEAELQKPEGSWRLDNTRFFQPALFAIQMGLVDFWAAAGVHPAVSMGHSVGEIAAACCAGYLSRESGLRLVELRGRLMDEMAGAGTMAAVRLPCDDERLNLNEHDGVVIAAVNSAESCTLAGPDSAIDTLLDALRAASVHCHKLSVSRAFHSPAMESCAQSLKASFSEPLQAGDSAWISSVTGEIVKADTFDPDYWARNVRDSVQFFDATKAMLDFGATALLELGPNAVLLPYLAESTEALGKSVPVIASMRKDSDDSNNLAKAATSLYEHGCELDWSALVSRGKVVSLPEFPFERERLWLDWSADTRGQRRAGSHPWLSAPTLLAGSNLRVVSAEISLQQDEWLADHVIGGACLLPAASFIEMMVSAGQAARACVGALSLRNFSISQPLFLYENQLVEIQLQLECKQAEDVIRVFSRHDDSAWIEHASATIYWSDDAKPDAVEHIIDGGLVVDTSQFYEAGRHAGIEFGSDFRSLNGLRYSSGDALAEIQSVEQRSGYWMHPIEIDAALQAVGLAFNGQNTEHQLLIPLEIAQIDCVPVASVPASARAIIDDSKTADMVSAESSLNDSAGNTLLMMRGVRMQNASDAALSALQSQYQTGAQSQGQYRVDWRPLPNADIQDCPQALLVVSNDSEFVNQIGASFASHSVVDFVVSQSVDGKTTSVDFADGAALEDACRKALEQMVLANPQLAVHVIVRCTNVNAQRIASLTRPHSELVQLHADAVNSVFHIARGVTRLDLDVSRRLTVVSESAVAVTDGSDCAPDQAALWGFAATFATEYPEWRPRLIDIVGADSANYAPLAIQLHSAETRTDRLAIRDGACWYAQLQNIRTSQTETTEQATVFELHAPQSGVFDDLKPVAVVRSEPGPNELEIRSCALGINFRDVLNVLNEVTGPAGSRLGAESAGIVVKAGPAVSDFKPGDRVMAFALGGFASHLIVDSRLVAKIPCQFNMADAASIPVVFLTALYALEHVVKTSPGQKVLVHAGAGGVGLAAIQIALARGAHVYATAGSHQKRILLRDLGVHGVYSSRNLDFSEALRADLGKDRLDWVLNALAGEFIPASMALLKKDGHFMELGKRDDWDEHKAATQFPEIAYTRFDLGEIAHARPELVQTLFNSLNHEFEEGRLRPLPVTAYKLEQLPEAFRFMAKGAHIGKLVVALDNV